MGRYATKQAAGAQEIETLGGDYDLDLNPTVKPLYGHQEGAEFGYNPQKPDPKCRDG